MKANWISFIIVWLLHMSAGLQAQTPVTATPEDPAHQELRVLRTNVIEAITKGDFERTLSLVHTNLVVTWQNAEVCRGHKGLREFFNRVGQQTFRGYKVPPTPDELTILYGGDTGISFGSTVASYQLFGRDYEFVSRWTATVVKENGRWLLSSYHISMNVLDNPLLNGAKKALYWFGGIACLAGFALGIIVTKTRRPRSA
jgi:ketosteroid isomerase-like protein